MTKLVQELLNVAEAYAAAEGIPLKTVSGRVFNDGKKFTSLLEGADLQVSRFEAAMLWFSDNWPARTAWPKGIKRPVPSERAAT